MTVRSTAGAQWSGDLVSGRGRVALTSVDASFGIDWRSRSQGGDTVTPEELLAAAHSSCFSMAVAHELSTSGFSPKEVLTRAVVDFEPGVGITVSDLDIVVTMSGIDETAFQRIVGSAVTGCPVSQALSGISIRHTARLVVR